MKLVTRIYLRIYFWFRNLKEKWFGSLSESQKQLIKSSSLFDMLDQRDLITLINESRLVHYVAGSIIFKEGDVGDALYIIAEGSVRVFTYKLTKEKIALARLEKGSYFGEQALHNEEKKPRNASIEAITNVSLLKITEKSFHQVLKKHTSISKKLSEQGKKQLLANITKLVNAYEHLEVFTTSKNIKTYKKDEVIFKENEKADNAYIILEGSVNISIHQYKSIKNVTLTKGHIFGELAIIRDTLRAGTATAREPSVLTVIPKSTFIKYYEENPKLKDIFKSLNKIYSIPHYGSVEESLGQVNHVNTVTTTYKLSNGRVVIATSAENNFFVMEGTSREGEIYSYKKEVVPQIELTVIDNCIVAVRCYGLWEDLPAVCSYILDQILLEKGLLEQFTHYGIFKPAKTEKEEIVCECLAIKKKDVEKLVQQGVTNLSEISNRTGACTVCGACRHRIVALLGQKTWLQGKMIKAIDHNEDVASFYVEPTVGVFNKSFPGEHIVIQAKIDDNWVERPYSLSDVGDRGKHRVTIKNEGGIFTEWLFQQGDSKFSVFVSQPQGNFKLSNSHNAIVCFAGGIGIIPFFTFAKHLSKSKDLSHRPIHIIYIVPEKKDFIFLDEFDLMKKSLPNFKLTLWERRSSGYLPINQIASYVNEDEGAEVYICGPEGFETSILTSLNKINFREDKIFIEKFLYAGQIKQ